MITAVLKAEGKLKEIVLLEIQSTFHSHDGTPLAGHEVGVLNVEESGVATLRNGPRTLYGKMQDLKNPLVMLEKTDRVEYYEGNPDRPEALFAAHGIVRRKCVFNGR